MTLQKLEKAKHLAATLLADNDATTGIRSQVQALGSGNPFTIKTTEESLSSVTVQGGRFTLLENKLFEYFMKLAVDPCNCIQCKPYTT